MSSRMVALEVDMAKKSATDRLPVVGNSQPVNTNGAGNKPETGPELKPEPEPTPEDLAPLTDEFVKATLKNFETSRKFFDDFGVSPADFRNGVQWDASANLEAKIRSKPYVESCQLVECHPLINIDQEYSRVNAPRFGARFSSDTVENLLAAVPTGPFLPPLIGEKLADGHVGIFEGVSRFLALVWARLTYCYIYVVTFKDGVTPLEKEIFQCTFNQSNGTPEPQSAIRCRVYSMCVRNGIDDDMEVTALARDMNVSSVRTLIDWLHCAKAARQATEVSNVIVPFNHDKPQERPFTKDVLLAMYRVGFDKSIWLLMVELLTKTNISPDEFVVEIAKITAPVRNVNRTRDQIIDALEVAKRKRWNGTRRIGKNTLEPGQKGPRINSPAVKEWFDKVKQYMNCLSAELEANLLNPRYKGDLRKILNGADVDNTLAQMIHLTDLFNSMTEASKDADEE